MSDGVYTIGQVAEMTGLPVSTLRYYDREGLLPGLQRRSGVRLFNEQHLEALRVVECLKASGLEIADIRRFMEWCAEGATSYPRRHELFARQRERVREQMARLRRTLAMLDFKCWYYEQAMRDGHEERLRAMIPDALPPEIRPAFAAAHADPDAR